MTNTFTTLPIPGTFDISTAAPAPASQSPGNGLASAYAAMLDELRRVPIPTIDVTPMPEQFEDMADHIEAIGRIMDRYLEAVGAEVASCAAHRVDRRQFKDQFFGAVSGNATHECDRAAEVLREEYGEVEQAVRHGRTALTIIDAIRGERGL